MESDDSCRELQRMMLDLYDAFQPGVPNKMNHYQLDFLRELQQRHCLSSGHRKIIPLTMVCYSSYSLLSQF